MAEIDIIRELSCYEKMYMHLFKTVDECIEICKDPVVKETLIKAMQEAEDIYLGDESKIHNYLTTDEKIIVLLLSYIRETEFSKEPEKMDSDIFKEALEWNLALNRVNNPAIDKKLKEHLYKIFHPENT